MMSYSLLWFLLLYPMSCLISIRIMHIYWISLLCICFIILYVLYVILCIVLYDYVIIFIWLYSMYFYFIRIVLYMWFYILIYVVLCIVLCGFENYIWNLVKNSIFLKIGMITSFKRLLITQNEQSTNETFWRNVVFISILDLCGGYFTF